MPEKSKALWIHDGSISQSRSLTRAELSQSGDYDENWLQQLIFEKPEVVPIETIDPGAGSFVPICRELMLPKEGGRAFLDILGVTPTGRLVLIECKLWRNPQARREVIGQIMEYGALLQRWTYSDLTAHLKADLGLGGQNPLFDHVKKTHENLDENAFVDAVSGSLDRGDFNLLVAGDGIRSDIQAIKSYLDIQRGLASRLALIEFQVWTDSSGATLVTPLLPLRTSVIKHRVIVGADDIPLQVETDETASVEIEKKADPVRAANRAFWQRFIDTLDLDHPDQPPARHGGNQVVRLDFPAPSKILNAWKLGETMGVAFALTEDGAGDIFDALEAEADSFRAETELKLQFQRENWKGSPEIVVSKSFVKMDEESQLSWLRDATNAFVNAFRPWLTAWSRDRGE